VVNLNNYHLELNQNQHINLIMNKVWKVNLIVFVLVFLVQISLVSALWDAGDIIHYYKMDGYLTDIVSGDNLTSIGDYTNITGILGGAVNLNGTVSNYFTMPNTNFINDTFRNHNWTLSLWFYPNSTSGMSLFAGNTDFWFGLYYGQRADNVTDLYVSSAGVSWDMIWAEAGGNGIGLVKLNIKEWNHILVRRNSTTFTTWINGEKDLSVTVAGSIVAKDEVKRIGLWGTGGLPMDGSIDEIGWWNRSLTNDEILELYNSGDGLGYGTAPPIEVTLQSPSNGYLITEDTETFVASYVTDYYSLSNANYNFWNSDGNIFNQATYSINSSNTTKQDFNFFLGNYTWNVYACGENTTTTSCEWASSNYSFSVGPSLDSLIYTNLTYETSSETFKANYHILPNSIISSAQIIYNGTNYTATTTLTSTTVNISKTLDIPLVTKATDIKNIQFRLVTTKDGYESITLTSRTQNISNIHLILCNATYTVPYINFTFKDESSSAIINASIDLATFDYWLGSGTVIKEYVFQNTTHHLNYAFCFAPADKPITIDVDFKYSKTSYPQRTYTYDDKALTNSTTTKILYLLSSTDGIYSTIQFLDAGTNSPISGVEVTAEREILGTWTLINQGITDAAGAITFWVNPDYEHRITATKTGYASVQETIIPTQTSYTIFMGTSATVSIPSYRYKNIKYITYPAAGRLDPNTIYTFGFNITADEGNIVSCRIDIKNLTLSTVATSSIGCGDYGGNISVSYNVGSNSKLFGYYYIDIGDGLELFKANDAWYVEYLNVTSTGGLISFFESLGDLPEWGDTHNRQEFSKVVFFFFIMILTIGIFTFFSGYELSSPGAALILVWGFIAFGAVSGIINMEGLTPYDWWNKYAFFIMVSFLFFGFILNKIRRDNM